MYHFYPFKFEILILIIMKFHIETSIKPLEKWHKFKEDHERKVSATRKRLSQMQKEVDMISDQNLPRLREDISKNEVLEILRGGKSIFLSN